MRLLGQFWTSFFRRRFHTRKKAQNAYRRTKTKKTAFLCALKTSKRKKVACLALEDFTRVKKHKTHTGKQKQKRQHFPAHKKDQRGKKSLVWRFVLFMLFTLFIVFVLFVLFMLFTLFVVFVLFLRFLCVWNVLVKQKEV